MRAAYVFLLAFIIFQFARPLASGAMIDHSAYRPDDYAKCLGCHPKALPLHQRQTPKKILPGCPLGSDGKMVCLSCHDCISGTCFLRVSSPEQICRTCHDCTLGMGCLLGIAHMGDAPDIEGQVHNCLTCHDGSVGKQAGGPGEHKTDVLYIKGKDMKTVTDRKVVFVNGKVTCISCHNPYGIDSAKISKPNTESRLCLTCHRK
ncbi:MAG: cytochrome c3 family protein [Thermodesulfovibrionales bacterium]|nr:cytochrome c3 family protein [Thermodesulfovibrionales bacterium]